MVICMNKIELLAPVGNIESLYQAIANGADAVYLGGKKYGARSYANNFYNEELISAIKYCHLYGVKIYVTVPKLPSPYYSKSFNILFILKKLDTASALIYLAKSSECHMA